MLRKVAQIPARIRYRLLVLYIALIGVIGILGWEITDRLGKFAHGEVVLETRRDVEIIADTFSSEIGKFRQVVKAVAILPELRGALSGRDEAALVEADQILGQYNRVFEASVMYLLDTSGLTIAASNKLTPTSFLGKNYAWRPYFKQAMAGDGGKYVAYGLTSFKMGYYASAPVHGENGAVLGVVAMKKDLEDLQLNLAHYPFCFFIDHRGVIFLAGDQRNVLKSLWPIPEAEQREIIATKQFGEKPFPPVFSKPLADGDEIVIGGKRFFVSRYPVGDDGWSVVLLHSLERSLMYRTIGIVGTLGLCFLFLIPVIFIYVTAYVADMAREEERRLADIINFLPDATIVIDAEGKVIAWNRSVEELTGVKAAEMVGKRNYAYALPFYHEGRPMLIDLVKDGGKDLESWYPGVKRVRDTWIIDQELKNVHGKDISVWAQATPLYDNAGHIVGAIEVIRDVSDEKKAAEELKKAYEQLKALQAQLIQSEKMASIGQLAAGVAHEINNPAGYAFCNIDILQEYVGHLLELVRRFQKLEEALDAGDLQGVSGIQKELQLFRDEVGLARVMDDILSAVTETREGLQRIKGIVQDLKSFAHPGSDDMVQEDIHKVIDSALNVVRNEIKYKIDLIKDFGSIPKIVCSPSALSQVFMNLLLNAAQSIKEHGTITIRTSSLGNKVVIEMSDTGAGMSMEVQSKLFEPFFTTKPVGQGTGLGLSIVYGIIKRHEGTITVKSAVGDGTTFTIELPIMRTPPSSA